MIEAVKAGQSEAKELIITGGKGSKAVAKTDTLGGRAEAILGSKAEAQATAERLRTLREQRGSKIARATISSSTNSFVSLQLPNSLASSQEH